MSSLIVNIGSVCLLSSDFTHMATSIIFYCFKNLFFSIHNEWTVSCYWLIQRCSTYQEYIWCGSAGGVITIICSRSTLLLLHYYQRFTICPIFAVFCFSAGSNKASPFIIHANALYSLGTCCTTLAPGFRVKCR